MIRDYTNYENWLNRFCFLLASICFVASMIVARVIVSRFRALV
jgi:hypothetical protein